MSKANPGRILATVVLTFFMAGGVPVSCGCLNSCGCFNSGNDVKDFAIEGFAAETTDANLQPRDTTQYHTFDAIFKAFYVNEKTDLASADQKTGLFVPSAMACSPQEPRAIQNFASISIIARNHTTYRASNAEILPGEDISDLFHLGFFSGNLRPITAFINDQFAIEFQQRYMLRLVDPPHAPTVLHFDIVIEMSDSQKFVMENEIIKVSM